MCGIGLCLEAKRNGNRKGKGWNMISHTWLEKWKKREGIGRRKKISENAKAERVSVCKMCLVGLVGDGRGLGKCEGGKRQHRRTATVFGVGISYIFFASFAFLNALVLLD